MFQCIRSLPLLIPDKHKQYAAISDTAYITYISSALCIHSPWPR